MSVGTRIQVRISRRVVVGTDRQISVSDLLTEPYFRAVLMPSRGTKPGTDESPRAMPALRLQWPDTRTSAVEPLRGGYRVETRSSDIYELLEAPRTLKRGGRKLFEAQVQLISELYPWEGEIREQGGNFVANLSLAMWSANDRQEDTGEYEDRIAECPIEFEPLLKRNRHITMGGEKFNILSTAVDVTGPRVTMGVRKIGG